MSIHNYTSALKSTQPKFVIYLTLLYSLAHYCWRSKCFYLYRIQMYARYIERCAWKWYFDIFCCWMKYANLPMWYKYKTNSIWMCVWQAVSIKRHTLKVIKLYTFCLEKKYEIRTIKNKRRLQYLVKSGEVNIEKHEICKIGTKIRDAGDGWAWVTKFWETFEVLREYLYLYKIESWNFVTDVCIVQQCEALRIIYLRIQDDMESNMGWLDH